MSRPLGTDPLVLPLSSLPLLPSFPSHRFFVDELLAQLSQFERMRSVAPLGDGVKKADACEHLDIDDFPEDAQRIIHTLNEILPAEFIPALDILDQRRAIRYVLLGRISESDRERDTKQNIISQDNEYYIYHVTSSAPRYIDDDCVARQRFEARLDTWSCSCDVLTWAGTKNYLHYKDGGLGKNWYEGTVRAEPGDVFWGGCAQDGDKPPVCRHLLACALAERCEGLFGDFIKSEWATIEELAELALTNEMVEIWDEGSDSGDSSNEPL